MPYHTRNRSQTLPPTPSLIQPDFPPPGLKLHPDDEGSKVLNAIAKSLLAVNNRAMTIKDLAEAALKHGLVSSGSSPLNAASQQITSYIRLHQRRCDLGESAPILKSHVLNGTSDDDLLTDALYSRSGGTATRKGGAVDTAFRKGTLVWYLSPETGAVDPFKPLLTNKKRRRLPKAVDSSSDAEEDRRPRIKLKIKLGPLSLARSIPPLQTPIPVPSDSSSVSLISPISSSSLQLPPYPIQSHSRHLRNIPNSPFDLPEYASPPPDSEDDFDDFHTSMMAALDDSDYEFPPPSVKDESDSDFESSSGRRSRSTSWTTVADPKTPHDVDKPLTQATLKVEGDEDNFQSSLLSYAWEPFVKREEGISELDGNWITRDEVADILSLDKNSFSLPMLPPLISKVVGPGDEINPGHAYHTRIEPVLWRTDLQYEHVNASHRRVDEDDIEILGPCSVPPEEFDECLWTCQNSPPGVAESDILKQEISIQRPQESETYTSIRHTSVNGIRICELDFNGFVLRRRLDDRTIHLTSLLHLLSSKSPSGDFMRLDGASHIKDGILKGTWVPLSFARNLVRDRTLSKELIEFLQDREPNVNNDTAAPPVFELESSPLLSTFEPISTMPTPSDRMHFKFPFRRLGPISVEDDLIWQRDGLTDWKMTMDLDHSLAFPRLPQSVRPNLQSDLSHLQNESPLSPQEEEIFHSLVDLGMGKTCDQDRTDEDEPESVLEADDEQDSPTQLRRSKRVAARSVPTRAKISTAGAKRGTRAKRD